MDDEIVASFIAITDTTPERARQYLELSDHDLQQAVELFYNSDGISFGETAAAPAQPAFAPPVPDQTRPQPQGVINLDSDEDEDREVIDLDGNTESSHRAPVAATAPVAGGSTEDDDAAMARRLQEEYYGGGAGGNASGTLDAEGYRAPIAPVRETLVGPGSYDLGDDDDRREAVLEQLQRRAARRGMSNCYVFSMVKC